MSLDDVVARCFNEAMPRGDLTSRHLGLDGPPTVARPIARQDLTLAGRRVLELSLNMFAGHAEFGWQFDDGADVLADQIVGWVKAPARAWLTAEAIALDLMGRASGIATLTRAYAREIGPGSARVTCAPRTNLGLRELDHAGVLAGGGVVPAGDRSDTIYVSANAARAAGSLGRALDRTRTGYAGPITAECVSLDDVDQAVRRRVTRVVLTDAVDPAAARARVPSGTAIEAGDQPTLARARELAVAGVDFVRVSALTLSPPRAAFELSPT